MACIGVSIVLHTNSTLGEEKTVLCSESEESHAFACMPGQHSKHPVCTFICLVTSLFNRFDRRPSLESRPLLASTCTTVDRTTQPFSEFDSTCGIHIASLAPSFLPGNGNAGTMIQHECHITPSTFDDDACNASTAGESSIRSRSHSVQGTNGIGTSTISETTTAAKMKRRHRKTSRAWGKSAHNINPNCSNSNNNNIPSTSCTHHQQQNDASEVGADADTDQRRRRRSSFAASKKRNDSLRSEATSGTACTEEMTVSSSYAEHAAGTNRIGNAKNSPRYIETTNGGGGKGSASSSICSSSHCSTRSARSSQPYSARYSSSMVGGPDVHPLAIAYEVEEEIVEELEEELSVLANKTRAALNDSYAEVDELRKENADALEVLDNMEAELRSLLDEKREWEGRILASEAIEDCASRRGSCSGIVVTSGGANFKSGNIKMGSPAPTSDLFRQFTRKTTGSGDNGAPTSDQRRLQAPNRSSSFLNRFSLALASENDTSQSQTTIPNVSVRRQSAVSVLSSDNNDDDDDEDFTRSISILDFVKSEDDEQDQGSGRGWRSLRESFSTSVSNLLVNLNSEGESLGNSIGSSMASSRSFLKAPIRSNLEIALEKQLRHLQSERNSATNKLDAQLQEVISAENKLIKKHVAQTDELNGLRLRLSDLKISRNLAKSKAQDGIIDLQTHISKLIQSIDEKVNFLQAHDMGEIRPNKSLRKEKKRLNSELRKIITETETLQVQCSQPKVLGTIQCAMETS